MKHISIRCKTFHFLRPAGTSRGVYLTRKSWILRLTDDEMSHHVGIGECGPLPDLSCDAIPDYPTRLRVFCDLYCKTGVIPYEAMRPYPSMLFGLETAVRAFESSDGLLFDSAFARGEEGIPINGLVWMGNYDEMSSRIEEKLRAGFHCIKLKIGAIGFDEELALIRKIRNRFSPETIELRLDANGAFSPASALTRLEQMAPYGIHSIEQPIRQGQWESMAALCTASPIPIALDEELIGVNQPAQKDELLRTIRPAYIILKPSLHGGMAGTREWVDKARRLGIGSWITSALEGNVGLNAVAQLTADIYGTGISLPQGLGTGLLYSDNMPTRLEIRGERLWHVAARQEFTP